jgi:hypothetical protein
VRSCRGALDAALDALPEGGAAATSNGPFAFHGHEILRQRAEVVLGERPRLAVAEPLETRRVVSCPRPDSLDVRRTAVPALAAASAWLVLA